MARIPEEWAGVLVAVADMPNDNQLNLIYESNRVLFEAATLNLIRELLEASAVTIDLLMRLQAQMSTSRIITQIQNSDNTTVIKSNMKLFIVWATGLARVLGTVQLPELIEKLGGYLFCTYQLQAKGAQGTTITSFLQPNLIAPSPIDTPDKLKSFVKSSVVTLKPSVNLREIRALSDKILKPTAEELKTNLAEAIRNTIAVKLPSCVDPNRRDAIEQTIGSALSWNVDTYVSMKIAYEKSL